MPSYFITGASRGIGLNFVKTLLQNPSNVVFAAARNPDSEGIKALKSDNLIPIKLDVTKWNDYPAVVAETEKRLGDKPLDYLILNAGVDLQTNSPFLQNNDPTIFEEELRINVLAPVFGIRSFLPLLSKNGHAGKAITLTTILGSLTVAEHIPFLSDSYSVAKAATNMAIRKLGASLKTVGSPVTLLLAFPGWIPETELGAALKPYFDKYAPDTEAVSLKNGTEGVLDLLHNSTKEDHTKFFNWKKEPVPW